MEETDTALGYLDELSATFIDAYAGVVADINGALVRGIRQMAKSFAHLRLIQGGQTAELRKAGAAAAPKAPAAPKVPGQKKVRISHPGARGGKWYRDDKGNVRYGTKPTPRFHTGLSEEEEAQLHANINVAVSELSNTNLNSLAKVMDVDPQVLDTLRTVSQQAAAQGLDPHECFAETYAESYAAGEQDAEGNLVLDPDKVREGHELYGNMAEAFKIAAESDKWKKAAQRSLVKQRYQAVTAARSVDRQRPLLKGHYEALLSGDINHEGIKSLGVMHDLGLFTLPKTLSEAKTYTDDIEQARGLVGHVSINGERLAAMMKFGDALEAEQQMAMVAVSMLAEEQAVRDDNPLYDREEFWKNAEGSPALDELRDLLKARGKDYSDAEFAQVKDRAMQLARHSSDQMHAYNTNQGGHVFKALFHNTTSLKKLFSEPDEVANLANAEGEIRVRVERALRAQTDYEHPLEPNITAAMKQIAGPDGDMFGFQKAAVAWMKEIKSGVLAYDAGTGKRQPDETPTLTPDGWKRLDAIAVGDAVVGVNGKPVTVLGVFPHGVQETYRLKFSDGTVTESGPEHLWHVFSTSQMRRGQHEVLELAEIMRRGLTSPNGRARFMIPMCAPVQFPKKVQPIPAYTLGVLLGDGCLSAKSAVELANSSEEVLQRVSGEVALSGLALTRKHMGRTNGGRGVPNTYGASLQLLGLWGVKSAQKFVPDVYLHGSVEQRIALLQGLCDTDGYINKSGGCPQFSSASLQLACDFRELVQSLGGIGRMSLKASPKYTYKGEARTGQPSWIVTFNLPRGIEPFTREDRACRYRQRETRKAWGLTRTIVEITRIEDKSSRCIKIANEDGLYLTNDYIVTHNTPISIAFVSHLIASGKAKRGIMVLPANLVAQWPKEIERFRPGSKVQVISADSGSIEDRLLKLKAINSGELEADFVILSAGTIGVHQDTDAAIESDVQDFKASTGQRNISKQERAKLIQEGAHLQNDPLVQALKNLDGAMIFDECFVAGTMVGDRRIEDIVPGDIVPAFDEATGQVVKGKVMRLFRNPARQLVRVSIEGSGASLVCTPGHPFYTQRGWVVAAHLQPSDRVLRTAHGVLSREADCSRTLHDVPGDGGSARQATTQLFQDRQGLLFEQVPQCGDGPDQLDQDGRDKPQACLSPHEEQQPHEQVCGAGAHDADAAQYGLETACAGGQRQGADCTTSVAGESSGKGLGDGVCDWSQGPDPQLQGRHCPPDAEGSNRSGWASSQLSGQADPRSAQDPDPQWVGLASVEVLQPGSDGRFGGVCADGLVYNIEVEKLHTYVANGIVVHNCHHGGQGLKDPTNTHHLIAREILKDREYKFGMSATPMPDGPQDLFHLSNLFHPGSAGESLAKFKAKLVKYHKTVDPDTGELKVVPVERDMKELAAAKQGIAPFCFFQRKTGKKVTEEMDKKGMKLPKLNSVSHPLSLTPEARQFYDSCKDVGFDEGKEPLFGHPEGYLSDKEMQEKMHAEHGPKAAAMVMKMRGFIRQQRAAISPKLLDKNYKGPSPKIDESVDIIKRHFADPGNHDKPVVIFGSWMDSLDLMHDELVKAGIPANLMGKITGQVSVEDRDTVQDAVNAGKLKVVLIGIKAGGAGLNLQKKAYRNIFLDKPWTPADMEQAVGRTWRTGAKADTVHIHHMKIADTVDDRKYSALGSKVQLVDSLAFADQDQEYLGGMVGASLKRLAGSFDDTVQAWTPEQHEQMMQLAGLAKHDTPFADIPALREDFDLQSFGRSLKKQKWKEVGDEKIKEISTLNDLKLKNGAISAKAHARLRTKISKMAKRWMKDTNAAISHPIAKFVGEDFHFGTEAQNSILGTRSDFVPGTRPRNKKLSLRDMPPPMPIDLKGAKLKLTKKSRITLAHTERNDFAADSLDWHLWEVLRRARPANVAGVIHLYADCLQEDGAEKRAEAWALQKGGFLQTLRARGLLEIRI